MMALGIRAAEFDGPVTRVLWADGATSEARCVACGECLRPEHGAPTLFCVGRHDPERELAAAVLERLRPGWREEAGRLLTSAVLDG